MTAPWLYVVLVHAQANRHAAVQVVGPFEDEETADQWASEQPELSEFGRWPVQYVVTTIEAPA